MPYMKDVAEEAGVSVSTVSFVLSGKYQDHKISEETARKVMRAARKVGYHVNRQNLSPSGQNTICIFFPQGRNNRDLGRMATDVIQYLSMQNIPCRLLLEQYDSRHLDAFLSDFSWESIDAAIVITYQKNISASVADPGQYPLVFYNCQTPDFSSVYCDSVNAVQQLCDVISSKNYHNIAAISSRQDLTACDALFDKILDKLVEMGICINENAKIEVENSFYGGGLAARKILNMEERPDLILCMNTILARGAIPVFARGEFYIPNHCEMAAVGSDYEAEYLQAHIPSLTMIEYPFLDLCHACADIALSMINEDRIPVHRTFQCRLLLRESLTI